MSSKQVGVKLKKKKKKIYTFWKCILRVRFEDIKRNTMAHNCKGV